MQATAVEPTSARGRVRALLIDRLREDGFRFRARTPEDRQERFLTQMADDLSYLNDEELGTMYQVLKTKGVGAEKCFWPERATILGFAEHLHPRPLIQVPGVLSWFKSKAGPEARARNRHVAEYLFWQKYKRPPLTEGERKRVSERGEELEREAQRARERLARFGSLPEDERMKLEWYDGLDRDVTELITGDEL